MKPETKRMIKSVAIISVLSLGFGLFGNLLEETKTIVQPAYFAGYGFICGALMQWIINLIVPE